MLAELGVVEQRYRAVLEVLEEGLPVTEVARRHGVARQTVHEWLARYAQGGLGGLADRSSRPASCPHQMPAADRGADHEHAAGSSGVGAVADRVGAGAGAAWCRCRAGRRCTGR